MDLELQTLERRWRQTRADEDEARWLAARVRAGDLPRERLLFAADLGHPAALLALDRPADPGEALEFLRMADPAQRALGRLGRLGLVRVGLAALEAQVELIAAQRGPVHAGVAPVIAAVRAWCASPHGMQVTVAQHLASALWSTDARRLMDAPVLPARRLAEALSAPLPEAGRAVELTLRATFEVGALLSRPGEPPPSPLAPELAGATPAAVRDAYERRVLARVQEDVVPWALGAAA